MTFNWHELDRDNVLYWALVHAMVQKKGRADREAMDLVSANSDKLTKVDIKMLINGVEYDGARLIEDLYKSMSISFDRAVSEKALDLLRTKWISIEDIIDQARRDIDDVVKEEISDQ